MWRKAGTLLLLASLGGCTHVASGPEPGGCGGHWGRAAGPPAVPGLQGAYGQRVPMAAPYTAAPPGNAMTAAAMMSHSVPLSMVQMSDGSGVIPASFPPPGGMPPSAVMPPGGILSPPGVPFAPGMPGAGHMPYPPGMMPPGAMGAGAMPPGGPGMVAAMPPGAGMNAVTGTPRFASQRTQARFTRPAGMRIAWLTRAPDGRPAYSQPPLETPGKYNFLQGAIYQLKLSNIEGRPGLEIYPTLEVVPSNYKTEEFLAHSYVPIEFTQEDFKQVVDGNYVIKVIYLPDPQFQDLAGTGTGEIVSTRLEPGVNPINEALRRGSILLVIRLGSIDREAPNTPPLSTLPQPRPVMPPGAPGMGMMPPGAMPGFPGPQGPMPPNFPGAVSLPPNIQPPPPFLAPGATIPNGPPTTNLPPPLSRLPGTTTPARSTTSASRPKGDLTSVAPPPALPPDGNSVRPAGNTAPSPTLPDFPSSQPGLRDLGALPPFADPATPPPLNNRR